MTIEAWPRCPEAAAFFEQQLRQFAAVNPLVADLEKRFRARAGVLLAHLVDHWILPEGSVPTERLTALGLVEAVHPEGDCVWQHPGARLPKLRFKSSAKTPRLALAVQNIDDFARQNGLTLDSCHGDPDSRYQCAHLTLENGELMPIVRRGYDGYAPGTLTDADRQNLAAVRQSFRMRHRESDAMTVAQHAQDLLSEAADRIGQARAVEEFFAAERDHYLDRNAAARWQFEQQQSIGIGWANHDHHTYRSSRAGFRALITLWKSAGFEIRERFYAGAEAGWGAQVMEHPVCRIILFNDVDVSPEELDIDFASVDLPERDTLGTIGLWCALHNDSIGRAGLHHLECEYDFEQTKTNYEAAGFGVMAPFTDLPMLKQAFTAAELWKVEPERARRLVEQGTITSDQAEKFVSQGAPGSHLEILQRWEGFKGFNKTGVSSIIRETDARNAG